MRAEPLQQLVQGALHGIAPVRFAGRPWFYRNDIERLARVLAEQE